jgi:multidrug efflux system membrane fusion protein
MTRIIFCLCCVIASFPLVAGTTVKATLEYVDRIELSTPLSGKVSQVNVKAGDRVTAGTILIQLDSGPLKAERDAAQAAVVASKASLDEVRREKQRSQDLYDQTLLSDHEIKQAEIDYATALSVYRQAKSKLALSQQRLKYSDIQAPFDGRVIDVRVQAGQVVANRYQVTPMVILAQSGTMLANVQLDTDQLNALKTGDAVNVAVSNSSYEGRIVEIGLEPITDQLQIRYPVSVEFSVPNDVLLRAGMPAQVDLP